MTSTATPASGRLAQENALLNAREREAQATILKSRPTFAWIGIGGRCNLDCAHCGIPPRDRRDPHIPELSREVFDMLKTELFPYLETCAFGGNNVGEPLFAECWDEYLEEAAQFGCRLILVTNGVLLNRERIARLVACGAQVNISLEGATRETYEAIRGPFYDRLIQNLALFQEERKRHPGTGTVVHLGFTAFYDNIRELPALVELAARYGVDQIGAIHFVPWYEYQRSQSLVYHKSLSNECFAKAAQRAQELGVRVFFEAPFEIEPMAPKRPPSDARPIQLEACFLPWTSISINEWGVVHPCCGGDLFMGNLNKESFEDVWNGPRYRRLRKTVNSDTPPTVCAACVQRIMFLSSAKKEANLLRNIGDVGGARSGNVAPAHQLGARIIAELEYLMWRYEQGRFMRAVAALEAAWRKVRGLLRGQ